jgi:hypothetical protein
VVIIVAYLAFAGYSIFQLSASDLSGFDTVQPALGNQSAQLTGDLAIRNPGVAPVNSINFKGLAALPNGTNLANVGLPSFSLGPSGSGRLPFSIHISFREGAPAEVLLFEDNSLHLLFALNVTYAYLFTVQVLATAQIGWGAPFYNFTESLSNPVLEPNGTETETLAVSFANHARFGVSGTLTSDVVTATGSVCGSLSILADAPGGQSFLFSDSGPVFGSPACFANATAVEVTYGIGGNSAIVFPSQPLARE